ncbi:uncharacterized protein LOC103358267 isoform X2 [Stegastes partitus]|uniref:Uncharacterized protein LOC103358267 isoform X2 n=1 Tax=Stegastes partitus TaxID=144197 RepID=A0A9Y4K1Q9_9TELE|nr:PREDICTED: uncharacterized protein LOC103358267 isoform X2 [Stegastes partitus]
MANPTDDSAHPQPQSGEQAHTQESGDAGLSSKMKHKFCEKYTDSSLSVEEESRTVRPIPKEEAHMSEMSETMPPPPSEFGLKSEPVVQELVKPSGLSVVDGNKLQPQFPQKGQRDNRKEDEEALKALPGTTAITGAEGGASCIMDPGMDAGGRNRAKRAAVVPKRGRKRSRYRKRAGAENNWKMFQRLVVVLSMNVVVCEGFPAKKSAACFTCNDYEKCRDLNAIYGTADNNLYQRGINDTIQECPKIPPPTPEAAATCTVCHVQSIVYISCSEGVTDIQPEHDGVTLTVTKGCDQQQKPGQEVEGGIPDDCPCRERLGLIAVAGVLVTFMIFCCWKCNRAKKRPTTDNSA